LPVLLAQTGGSLAASSNYIFWKANEVLDRDLDILFCGWQACFVRALIERITPINDSLQRANKQIISLSTH
jgi:hypothetical protein